MVGLLLRSRTPRASALVKFFASAGYEKAKLRHLVHAELGPLLNYNTRPRPRIPRAFLPQAGATTL
jgi:hypothetical protein